MLDFFKNIFGGQNEESPTRSQQSFGNKGSARDIKRVYIRGFEEGVNCTVQKTAISARKGWKTRVRKIETDNFTIEIPELMGVDPLPIKVGDTIHIKIPCGNEHAVFDSQILNIPEDTRAPNFEMEYPQEVNYQEIRKRKHVRVNSSFPARIMLVDSGETDWEPVRLYNFSVSGLAIGYKRAINENEIVKIKITSMQFPLTISGVVVRNAELEKEQRLDNKDEYLVAIQYINVTDMDQQLLTSMFNFLQRMKT
ncbi:MAG: PilZ domain-containing protein [Vulcanimicrobiota bacterium]